MGAWIKGGLAALVAFGMCWGGAITWWQSAGRSPSTAELGMVLLAAPLALLGGFLVARYLLARRAAEPEAAAPAATDTPATPVPGPSLALMAAALRTPHGSTPDELAEAIASGHARADLDAELVDDEGYPVMSARVADPVDPELRDAIALWLAAEGLAGQESGLALGEEQWRALGMVTGVAAELAHHAAAHPHALPDESMAKTPLLPTLQVLLALSDTWNEAQRNAAAGWIRHMIGETGWPAGRIAVSVAAQPSPSAAMSHWLTQLTAQAAGTPTLAMLLTCDSQIGEASVDALAAGGRLFLASRQQGLIPGEGAAGVLLGDTSQVALLGGDASFLHVVAALRDDSADNARTPGRPADAALLRRLATQACTQGAVEPAAVAMLVADSGHRTGRTMELMDLATRELAQLDAGADVVATGTACGHAGAVPFVSALALAHLRALERQAPVLCVSNEDPYHRSAVLVRPPSLQS